VRADRIEPAAQGLQQITADQTFPVTEIPSKYSVAKDWIEPGGEIKLLGRHKEYWLIQTESGLTGWMSLPQPGDSDGSKQRP
jgi:hypothetical protein